MSWLDEQLKEFEKPRMGSEKSYITGKSADAYETSSYPASYQTADFASSGGGEAAAASGAGAAGMSSPAAAGIMAGGQFLSNYLAQKAADERARRDRAAQIEQQYAQNQNQGFDTMMKAFGGALK
ncbi:MAG: hypothetical protein OM95_06895 [Bdellovibrio sp. ArHS]|uniref:hypothetical protein n=1 Tax=Bdellovibrio sp. ArHS TaxID=1569284 RepID=UPI000582B635|nr:hypothetical protein [Bdellovibrio sp. ArHS]KHD88837.1 MAG: hypothetical protein OM95_06895 [Bdellovibrio sp. ArHS]